MPGHALIVAMVCYSQIRSRSQGDRSMKHGTDALLASVPVEHRPRPDGV